MPKKYCIIHGKPVDANGDCELCPKRKVAKAGSKEEALAQVEKLTQQLDNQRQGFELINEQFNESNGNLQAEREKNQELQAKVDEADGILKQEIERNKQLADKLQKATDTIASKDEQFAEETKRTSDALERIAELEAQLKEAQEGDSAKAADTASEKDGSASDADELELETEPAKPAKTGAKKAGAKKK